MNQVIIDDIQKTPVGPVHDGGEVPGPCPVCKGQRTVAARYGRNRREHRAMIKHVAPLIMPCPNCNAGAGVRHVK